MNYCFVLQFSAWWWGHKITMQDLSSQKESLKSNWLGHQMMHGKAIWKPGIGEIAKASMDIAPEPHKTQSFMISRG